MTDGILNPLYFSDYDARFKCIKGKQTNMRRLGVNRILYVLKLKHMDIYGLFPTASWNDQKHVHRQIFTLWLPVSHL